MVFDAVLLLYSQVQEVSCGQLLGGCLRGFMAVDIHRHKAKTYTSTGHPYRAEDRRQDQAVAGTPPARSPLHGGPTSLHKATSTGGHNVALSSCAVSGRLVCCGCIFIGFADWSEVEMSENVVYRCPDGGSTQVPKLVVRGSGMTDSGVTHRCRSCDSEWANGVPVRPAC